MGLTLDCCTGLISPQSSNLDDYPSTEFHKNRKQKNRKKFECKIIELKESHRKKCQSLLIDIFIKTKYDAVHHDLENKQVFKTYINYYLSKSINKNNNIKSFVAVNAKNEKEVVGILLCDNYFHEMDTKSMNDLITRSHSVDDDYEKIFKLYSEIKEKYKQNIKNNNNDIFEFKLSAVKADYHRLGIMTKLKQFALDEAKKLNYTQCISISLNNATINLNKKIGFNQQVSIKYDEWKYKKYHFPFKSAAEETGDEFAVLMHIDL